MAARTKTTTVSKLYRKRNVLIMLCLLFLILSITIAILTYYGQSAGGFSIKLADEAEEMGLQLSTEPSFNTYSVRLIADSVSDAQPTSYDLLEEQNVKTVVKENNGTYIPKTDNKGFMGYTFYVRNIGSEDVLLTSTFNISSVKKNVDKALWVWAFFGEDDENGTVYQAPDDLTVKYPNSYPSRNYFLTETKVFNKTNLTLKVGTKMRISIIVWLEGSDPDCTDSGENSILGGSCRYSMQLSIRNLVI